MKRFISLALMVTMVSLLVLISGCSGNTGSTDQTNQTKLSKETVFDFYNKVQLDQTKDQVDAELGVVPTESSQLKNSFTYTDENTGFGVSVLFNENNQAASKTLFYPVREELAFLTSKPVTQEQADKITDGLTYDQVKSLLGGEGIEVSTTQIPFDNNKLSSIRIWVNSDGSMIQTVFGTDGMTNNTMFFN
ncbi:hypothetical protein [Acetobacterium sp.]|uniref:hypothetical protein n=1 Tax=Acetobacterium sp. TaxID=1872094 RepID=UPI002F40E8C3